MVQPGCVLAQAIKRSRTFFFEIQEIGTGNPVLGSLPVDPSFLECLANGLGADQPLRPALLDTLFGDQRKRPQTGFEPKIAWGTVQQSLESICIDAFEGSA